MPLQIFNVYAMTYIYDSISAMADIQIPEDPATLGNRRINLPFLVSSIRKQTGFTQVALAEEASLSRLTVVAAERGDDVRLSSMVAMFRAMGCELVPIPKHLVAETKRFVNNGGRIVAVEPGIEAPLSIMQIPTASNKKGYR